MKGYSHSKNRMEAPNRVINSLLAVFCMIVGLSLLGTSHAVPVDSSPRTADSASGGVSPSVVYGANDQEEKSPYGGSKKGEYGGKKAVSTPAEARNILKEYFSKKDVTIGEIKEKEFYFEAEIKDRKNQVIDKVIVDKRTGRIRSIY